MSAYFRLRKKGIGGMVLRSPESSIGVRRALDECSPTILQSDVRVRVLTAKLTKNA